MRIISGRARSRKLKSIQGTGTRPTLDRVKEAIFNILAPVLPDSKCLDLFAGFGGLGLEAISRGAAAVIFLENNYRNVKVIRENIELCDFREEAQVKNMDVFKYLNDCNKNFDLIFMDPPYGKGLVNKTISLISDGEFLSNKGLLIAEHHKNEDIEKLFKLTIIKEKVYGDTIISIFQAR